MANASGTAAMPELPETKPAQDGNSADVTAISHERVQEARRDSAAARERGHLGDWFAHAATRVSETLGSVWAFVLALAVIIAWATSGPIFGFSDTWQLVINTSTTIVTFLMVFVIQNTQNRDAKATQIKLDELIRAVHDARNRFIGEESEDDEELERDRRAIEAARGDPEDLTQDKGASG
jgi:low affinity Fe/Cu permease